MLQSYMLQQKKEGKKVGHVLQSLCCHAPKNTLNDLIESTWEMQNAKATLEREKRSRIQVPEEVRFRSCIDGCDMQWYICSRDILQKNSINQYAYADAIRDLLIHRRGKFTNVMITGPVNCGKNFILKPLEII